VKPSRFRSESDFISAVRRWAKKRSKGLVLGIGDDAAVFDTAPGERWCVTTDLLIEGVHFDHRFDSARSVGHKSLASGLSDLAAMGATPRFALVSIAVPPSRQQFLTWFYRGMIVLADRENVTLIGGDTSRSEAKIFVDVIALGTVRRKCEVLRSGARAGDHIFVTGALGKASLGLQILRSQKSPRSAEERKAVQGHLFPIPRSDVGCWLGENRIASAMIDVSDGLSTDLHHLCEESAVGATIHESSIPLPIKQRSQQMMRRALSGGEDYELLFTVSTKKMKLLPPRIKGVPVREIGTVVPRKKGITLIRADGRPERLPVTGWDHFR
jgi:thiamine-monophosphate kinase